jgi:hypothetical protein
VTTISASGGLAGGTIGCNYQFSLLVIGIEDDLLWNGLPGTASDQKPFSTAAAHALVCLAFAGD